MKHHLRIFIIGLLFASDLNGQYILNGDFEINTAVTDQINIINSDYTNFMSNSFAFGDWNGFGPNGGNMDIITSSHYCDSSQHGNWFVALTSGGTDAISLTLSSPLISGNEYTLSFYDRSCTGYPPGSPIKIGVSNTNNNFGNLVYTAPAPIINGGWTLRFFSFVAPINAAYITVTCDGIHSGSPWTQVDNFSLESPTNIQDINQNSSFQVFPNPASNALNIRSYSQTNFHFNVFNALGQIVMTGNLENITKTLSIEHLTNGLYYIELSTTDKAERKSFIVNK